MTPSEYEKALRRVEELQREYATNPTRELGAELEKLAETIEAYEDSRSPTPVQTVAPTTPLEVLVEEYLKPVGEPLEDFAQRIGATVDELQGGITRELAEKLGDALGTTPDFWTNLQSSVDGWAASRGA